MNTDSNLLQNLKLLEETFKYKFTDSQIKIIYSCMSEEKITDTDLQSGIKKLIFENKFMPVLADIISACKNFRDERIYEQQQKETISKEDASNFFQGGTYKNSDIGRDCIALIRKKLTGIITINNYIAEMINLEKKYPVIGFLRSANKLKSQIGGRE